METKFYDCNNFQQFSESQVVLPLENLLAQASSEHQLRNCVREKVAQGNYAVAIALINQLIALRPNSAMDYNNRGLMYFRNNQIAEALADLSLALKIDPKLDSAYNNRANCYAARGELAEAIADYDLALDLNPANIRAWINQGITFRELGMYELAIENFDIASVVSNALPERIYAERGRAYHLRGDWNCAVGDYQASLVALSNKPNLEAYRQKVQAWLDELLQPLNLQA
jgi:tetratricopeptide (TPR) repeat protein